MFTYSKLTIETLEHQNYATGIFIVNFEHIPHLFLFFRFVNFEHVIAGWGKEKLFSELQELYPSLQLHVQS